MCVLSCLHAEADLEPEIGECCPLLRGRWTGSDARFGHGFLFLNSFF